VPPPDPATLSALRKAVAALDVTASAREGATFGLGLAPLDAWLGGGLPRGALHEVYAPPESDTAAGGFGLGLALRAAGGRPLVWARQDGAEDETGRLYGDGLAALGLDPGRLLLVRARDPMAALRVAGEAARCSALGAALLEISGEARGLDLTASRRLALAASASGVTLIVIRLRARPAPSAAASRWHVTAAASTPLEAAAPGRPAFNAGLTRHRAGLGSRIWRLEWDSDSLRFAAPTLHRPMVSVPVGRPAAAPAVLPWRRAG